MSSIELIIKDCREHLKLYGEAFITEEEIDLIEKRIKELEEKNKHLKYLYDDCCKCLLDTIEKQKVKDKIEELDSIQKEMTTKKS